MSGIARLFTQTATVETYAGSGPYGDVYLDPVQRPCFVDQSIRLVRDRTGEEVVSSTRLYGPLSDAPDSPPTAGQYAPGSRVTVDGRTALVLAAARRQAGPSNAHHVDVHLT